MEHTPREDVGQTTEKGQILSTKEHVGNFTNSAKNEISNTKTVSFDIDFYYQIHDGINIKYCTCLFLNHLFSNKLKKNPMIHFL